jgi:hypothetical protein
MTTMTELDDAAFDIKRDIERTLVLALVAEAWDIGLWPTGAPVLIWWEVWNAEARGSEGQPGAFVRYEWPQQNRE